MDRMQASFLHTFRLNPSQLGNAATTGKVPQAVNIFRLAHSAGSIAILDRVAGLIGSFLAS
jgi:hypothetical protein